MKLLSVLTYYHPHWTGLTAVARRVAEGMADRGHRVTVLTSRFRRDLPTIETINGVRVVRLPVLARISRGVIMPAFPTVAHRLICEHDVVQVHTPMLEAPLLTALARRAGGRSVITHHGDLVMPRFAFDQMVEVAVTALLRRAFSETDRVVVYTQDYLEQSQFLRPFARKCVPVLPPAVLPEPDRALASAWRAELGLTGHHLVGFAGRFVEEKGFDILLQAAPLLARAVPHLRLAYAGERQVVYESFFGRCRELVKRVEPYIVWLGLLRDARRLAAFYAMCDVVAVPSRTDTFNLVQVEAMLAGTPVVMTDIPGGRVPVRLTRMGRLVPPQDEQKLAAGLLDVIQNRERYVRPRSAIESVFSIQRSLDEYERALGQWP